MKHSLLLVVVGMAVAAIPQASAEDFSRVARYVESAPENALGIVKSNLFRCFKKGGIEWSDAPATDAAPASMIISGSFGHTFSTITFRVSGPGTNIEVELIYLLGRKKRAAQWDKSIQDWFSGAPAGVCPKLP